MAKLPLHSHSLCLHSLLEQLDDIEVAILSGGSTPQEPGPSTILMDRLFLLLYSSFLL